MISSVFTLPSGRVGPKGRRGGSPRWTLRIGFAGEPWANAQRLIWSVAELARVWWTTLFEALTSTFVARLFCLFDCRPEPFGLQLCLADQLLEGDHLAVKFAFQVPSRLVHFNLPPQ